MIVDTAAIDGSGSLAADGGDSGDGWAGDGGYILLENDSGSPDPPAATITPRVAPGAGLGGEPGLVVRIPAI